MNQAEQIIHELRAAELRQTRQMTADQKLRACGDLFDDACQITLAGIRAQYPGISEENALEELRRRIARTRPARNPL